MNNPYKKSRNILGIFFLLGGILLLIISSSLDKMDVKYALLLIGIFLILSSLIVVWIFNKYSKLFARLMRNENIIDKWTIEAALFKEFVQYDKEKEIYRFRFMFYFIAGISILVGLFLIIIGLEIAIIAAIIFGIIAFVWLVSRIAILSKKKQHFSGNASIIIAKEGGMLNKKLHNWSQLASRLSKSKIHTLSSQVLVLEIDYTVLQRTGEVEYCARFPIQNNKENKERLEAIIEKIYA
jgi:MFS family permease